MALSETSSSVDESFSPDVACGAEMERRRVLGTRSVNSV
jgi:hypothetical protein